MFQPSLKCLFSLKKSRRGTSIPPPKTFNRTLNLKYLSVKRFLMKVSLYYEYKAPKLVKVKAYQRIRNGKVEKVRSHYRNVEGRLVIRNELHR